MTDMDTKWATSKCIMHSYARWSVSVRFAEFLVFSWLDSGCEDRKTERTLFPVGEVPTDSALPPNVKSRELFKFILPYRP